jgi:hypothetical protein
MAAGRWEVIGIFVADRQKVLAPTAPPFLLASLRTSIACNVEAPAQGRARLLRGRFISQ